MDLRKFLIISSITPNKMQTEKKERNNKPIRAENDPSKDEITDRDYTRVVKIQKEKQTKEF